MTAEIAITLTITFAMIVGLTVVLGNTLGRLKRTEQAVNMQADHFLAERAKRRRVERSLRGLEVAMSELLGPFQQDQEQSHGRDEYVDPYHPTR